MQPLDNITVCNGAQLVAIPMTHPQFKLAKFLRTKLPIFKGSTTLNEAESWIRTIEEKLTIVQCNDNEKVFYASHQLEGVALDWWKKFRAAHQDEHTITWAEFTTALCQQHAISSISDQEKPAISISYTKSSRCQLKCCQPDKLKDCTCTHCGEIGHSADEHNINCSSCEGNHSVGKCPMIKITCFLCESDDHCPSQCPMYSVLTSAMQHQQKIFWATVRTLAKEGKPLSVQDMSAKESQRQDVDLGNPPQKRSEPVSSRVCFECGEQDHYAKRCPAKRQTSTFKKVSRSGAISSGKSQCPPRVCYSCR